MGRLSSEFLKNYVAPEGVELPKYDRSLVRCGIVHFGPGNFSLAHMAIKTHAVMQSGDTDALNYGIVAVSTQRPDRRDQLSPQDGLYAVMEMDRAGENKVTIVGAVKEALYGPEDAETVIARLALPEARIVSMTITPQSHEAYMNVDGGLNLDHPDIKHDLNPAATPKTVYGFIARGIQLREAAGLGGFTLMNLDNMVHNGNVLGYMVREFTEIFDPSLKGVFQNRYSSVNSMVDRIVPKTEDAHFDRIRARANFADHSAVPAEPMPKIGSWVIENNFVAGCPAWAAQGHAMVVPNVEPYEQAKLRTLNVPHSFMANLGDLAGLSRIDETMNDPVLRAGTLALMTNETGPTLAPAPGIDFALYRQEIIDRFANPEVQDTTWRVAKDAPLQVVLDSARDQIAAGRSYELLALNVAAWMRRFRVEANELGGAISVAHPMADILKVKAKEGGSDPRAMFSVTEVFGDIGRHEEFARTVSNYMEMLDTQGVRAAIQLAVAASNRAAAPSSNWWKTPDGGPSTYSFPIPIVK